MGKIIMTTFWLVFIAELGDKTQVETMLLAAKCNSPIPVFIGSSLALIVASALATYTGGVITKFVPPEYIQYAAGIVFIIMGVLILMQKI